MSEHRDAADLAGTRPILRPGATCWRSERADRVAVLVDGAAFFAAVRAALLRARRSVILLGWDIDPRMRLDPHDPETLGDFLARLIRRRPSLQIHALKWDMPFPISLEHPHGPLERLNRRTGPRLTLELDDALPVGAAQHQKLVVVDDALAFCGGIDLAGDRWDTPEHLDNDPRRRWPTGELHAPRHDVMMAVDGPAARALGVMARERWSHATGQALPPPPPEGFLAAGADPWPEGLHPLITDADVGIARTLPDCLVGRPVRENEALTFAAIAEARHSIYLENQYFASFRVAEALARRLREPDGPEVVVVVPMESPSWFDRMAMDTPRGVVLQELRAADRHGRLRAMTPLTEGGNGIVVHSKLMVVDDRLLRIGSSNLNNRSMGYDTECDLAVESPPGDRSAAARSTANAIGAVRNRLLAEHMGVDPSEMTAAVRATGSVVAAIDRLNKPSGRRLAPLPDTDPGLTEQAFAALRIADPDRPEEAWAVWKRMPPAPAPARSLTRAVGAALFTAGAIAGVYAVALAMVETDRGGR
ncbi:phosphatidylserine/phosphatidylglycerophosphate/cardiolipin synthase-like enzyme [Azospirillum brasilense]|uniref:Phospholipase D n=1 Tax=Azospirillum brasilense TaxID=192 RepID=A0A560CJT5_AZOBR|nr:phospholipase D-like domain-containing protein [Azospirillum brasilense]MBK3736361.1 phospholipase [Azospirillum brasilense]TWA85113.1 phosphatidylserine/phosphatidylglycerophosphate/cardiolipin synthase-like enzyme [Azospirillum brasilense]